MSLVNVRRFSPPAPANLARSRSRGSEAARVARCRARRVGLHARMPSPLGRFRGPINPGPSPGNGGHIETSLSRFTRNLAR
eukprot:scaffold104510_cov54-Phaeocystis_antarctica.AAC.2